MSRDISFDNQDAAEAAGIAPVLFLDLAFDSGTVRIHSWTGDMTWGGNTYLGVGLLGSITPVQEDSELTRTPLTLTLSGIPVSMVAAVFNEQYQGRRATLYLGYLEVISGGTPSYKLVDDPFILYRGRMDTATIDQGSELTVSVAVESRFAAWDKPLVRRYNAADQQARYPGDRGLEFAEASTEKQIAWGTQLKT